MNATRISRWAALVFAAAFALSACTSGGGGHGKQGKDGSSSSGGKTVGFNYDMPYQLDQVGAGDGALTKAFSASDVFTGTLTATNTDTSEVQTFDWSVYLDESTLAVQSNKTIVLDPGTYDFVLLLHKGDHAYVGVALDASIADGTDNVPMTIRPVIGAVTTDVSVVARLIDLRFSYDPSEFSGAGISDPRIGISVDGGAEQLFVVNPASGFSEYMYLNLSPGAHDFVLRLFDGAIQRGKSLTAQTHQTLSPGVGVTMDLVALHGETTFSLAEAGGDATFHFVIPAEVVNEAGGTGDLDVQLHIVSAESGQDIEELLTLAPQGGDYVAEVTHSGFQFENVTISLAFVDHTDDYLLGACTHTVTLIDAPQTASCDVTLVRRAVVSGSLLATLGVNVFSTGFEPVAGANVYVDGDLVGVTGSGGFGTPGYLKVYVIAGTHALHATAGGNAGDTSVTVSALGLANPDIILDTPIATACFQLSNTVAEDLSNNDWFNSCADAVGSTVRVVLKDGGGNVVYEATGAKVGTWDHDHLTTTGVASHGSCCDTQYDSYSHDRLVTLTTGDKLMIAGQGATNAGCGGSFGAGYGIVIYPASPDYYFNPKMLVMPYRQFNYSPGTPRFFTGWSSANEVTWSGGTSFNTCSPGVGGIGYAGTFQFFVQ